MNETFVHTYVELEWWDARNGRELLLDALRAAGDIVADETVHVYNQDVLDVRCDDGCEMSLFASMQTTSPRAFFEQVRTAGIRVKEASVIDADTARAPLADVHHHLFTIA